MLVDILLLNMFVLTAVCVDENGETCGYLTCHETRPDHLNVHIVPAIHAELGGAKNIHQYYEGEERVGRETEVSMEKVYNSIVKNLWAVPSRRFTISNLPYFFLWWEDSNDVDRQTVYDLIQQGRLHFMGGGWGMSDESTAHYHAIIDHYTYGLRKLNTTFMSCGRPLVTWQADNFGHSREYASLMAQMGFDGHFISPISFDDELQRMKNKTLEFIWRGSDDLGPEADIFTHKLFDGYWPPPGYCFSAVCNDPPISKSEPNQERIKAFGKLMLENHGPYYTTKNILVVMGGRHHYYHPSKWFSNMDNLIELVNSEPSLRHRVHLMYSTPACYLKAVQKARPVLSRKLDDFFPLAYDSHTYATGQFTSRPTIKYHARELHLYLQIAKQLQILSYLDKNDMKFEKIQQIAGALNEHTILSGGMLPEVNSFYLKKIHEAKQLCLEIFQPALNLMRNATDWTMYHSCPFNISSCELLLEETTIITIYNPLAWPVTLPVRLPVQKQQYVLYDHNGDIVNQSIIPIPDIVKTLPERMTSNLYSVNYELVFLAAKLPAIGVRSYLLKEITNDNNKTKRDIIEKFENNQINTTMKSLENDSLSVIDLSGVQFNIFIENHIYNNVEPNLNTQTNAITPLTITITTPTTTTPTTTTTTPTTTPTTTTTTKTPATSTTTKTPSTKTPTTKIPTITTKTPTTTTTTTTTTTIPITTTTTKTPATTPSTKTPTTKIPTTTTKTPTTTTKTPTTTTTSPTTTTTTPTTTTTTPTTTTSPPDKYQGDASSEIHKRSETSSNKEFQFKNIDFSRYRNIDYHHEAFIRNEFIRINLNRGNTVKNISLANNISINLDIKMMYYVSDDPSLTKSGKKTPGTYFFRPKNSIPETIWQNPSTKVIKSSIVNEVQTRFSPYAGITVRLYNSLPYIEIDWVVGPIPTEGGLGKDVFIRYKTDLKNNGSFYTDCNGRQTIRRMRNLRAILKQETDDFVSGNYYPVTSKVYLEDTERDIRFSVFPDRGEGCTSLKDGELDIMVHRRLLTDDAGLTNATNESEFGQGLVVRGTHRLYLTKANYKPNKFFEKKFAKELEMRPQVFIVEDEEEIDAKNDDYESWISNNNEYSAMKRKLPIGIHILSFEKWQSDILIRLENYLERADVVKDNTKIVFISDVFNFFKITSCRETMLGVNVFKSEYTKMVWQKDRHVKDNYEEIDINKGISLIPQQIRTFICNYEIVNNK